MVKLKTNRAAKRFKKTGTVSPKNEGLQEPYFNEKPLKKEKSKKTTITDATNAKNMKKILPYL